MKVRSCWFALLLVGSSIISVSPNSSTTAITTFQPTYSSRISSETISSKLDSLQNYMLTTPTSRITSEYQNMLVKRIQFPARRKERDATQNNAISPCHQFEVGDLDQKILYSPNHPGNYPKNIDCVRILEAPEGHFIQLDFRDSFNIEWKEECKFDFLEVRDGRYGFSDRLERLCGQTFPNIINSKGRYLWLHFHSDESIEYSGFKAVYEFKRVPPDAIVHDLDCVIHKGDYEGFVNMTDVDPALVTEVVRNKLNLDCLWVITVKEGWKINLKFPKFNLDKPNDCDSNFIDVFGENTDIPSRIRSFCGSAAEPIQSVVNVVHVRFFAKPNALNSSFDALYTAYRERGTSECKEDEFDCDDATCISKKLECNGRDNCKFRGDELVCQVPSGGQSEHVIIIIVIFGLILGGMVATFFVNCIRKLLRDQKIIREHIRQSKESKLNEMGRASAKRSRENLSKLSPREKHSQSSLQILDDVSKRYYREIVPITVQDNQTDVKEGSILRQQHDIVIQTNLGEENSSPERGTCEMGCQTRESLFQPVGWKTSLRSSSPNESAAIRFSTFGYDVPPNKSQTLSRQTTSRDKTRTISTAIDIEETGFTEIPPRGPEVCLHHHQHQQHLQQQQQKLQQQHHHHQHQHAPGGKGKKVDESKVFIDIRNSAPDVIIMTSH